MRFGLIMLALGVAAGLLVLNHDAGRVFGIDSDDFARIVVLSILALTIGSVVVHSSKGRFGELAKAGALWILVMVVLVAAYGHRTEIEAIGRRTVGLVLPGVAIDTGEPGTVMVAKSRDGHFRVRAEVNGQIVRLVVDTGASSVVLTERDARIAGIDVDSLRYDVKVSTANGGTTAAPVLIDTLSIGEITEQQVAALVARPGQLETSLLGNSFLNRMASFTVEGDRLILKR